MPRILDDLLNAVVYLYRTEDDAVKGDRVGGTGFLLSRPSSAGGYQTVFCVTCQHVAERGAPVVRMVTRSGQVRIREDLEWQSHPAGDDVSVARVAQYPAELGYNYELAAIPAEFFVSRADLAPPSEPPKEAWPFGALVGPGDDTFTLGRFIAADGGQTNVPTARFGNLSSAGTTDMWVEPRQYRQEAFLVEARSLNGYSGSPVFLYHNVTTITGSDLPLGFTHRLDPDRLRLLGIDCGHLMVEVAEGDKGSSQFQVALAEPGKPYRGRLNSGIMTVVPAWKIGEVMDLPELNDEPTDEERDQAALDIATSAEPTEALLGQLLQVPKSEANEVHGEHQ